MANDCSAAGLLTVEQALQQMLEHLEPQLAVEFVPLAAAHGRVSASDVHSPLAVPPFDNSAMDGYALRSAEWQAGQPLPVAGRALAGAPFTGEVPPGSCLRIMTGAAVPPGLDVVVMQEQVELVAGGALISVSIKPGQNIRRTGEDIGKGQVVITAGQRLTSRDLLLLASLGIAQLAVNRRLQVALLSSGDELRPLGSTLLAGEIYDSNRYGLAAMLAQLGCDCLDLGVVADDPAALRQALLHADAEADVVISSGGVSVGEADYTRELLAELGQVAFWKVAMKPGKPFAFGRLANSWFFGLPGNPVSAMVTFYQLVQPALRQLAGEPWQRPLRLQARAGEALRGPRDRTDFQRGIASTDATGQLQVRLAGSQGSAMGRSLSQANCFIILEPQRPAIAAGEAVTIELFGAIFQ